MFARAVTARRTIPFVAAALLALAGCGGERQDANEPSGQLPASRWSTRRSQPAVGSPTARRCASACATRGDRAMPDVAVTVETKGASGRRGPHLLRPELERLPALADPNRPIWILDREPAGGNSAYANTWSLGRLGRAASPRRSSGRSPRSRRATTRSATASAPGLDGKARLAQGSRATGTFKVSISDKPVPARVDDDGNVVRGEEAGAGNCRAGYSTSSAVDARVGLQRLLARLAGADPVGLLDRHHEHLAVADRARCGRA